jgi:hypothetical protein
VGSIPAPLARGANTSRPSRSSGRRHGQQQGRQVSWEIRRSGKLRPAGEAACLALAAAAAPCRPSHGIYRHAACEPFSPASALAFGSDYSPPVVRIRHVGPPSLIPNRCLRADIPQASARGACPQVGRSVRGAFPDSGAVTGRCVPQADTYTGSSCRRCRRCPASGKRRWR